MRRDGLGGPFSMYVSTDAKKPRNLRIAYDVSPGLGLPDRDYYFRDSEDFENIRTKYIEYLEAMLTEAGHDNGRRRCSAYLRPREAACRASLDALRNS